MLYDEYVKRYPLVFKEYPICGMDIPDGWHVLVNNLSKDINEYLKEHPIPNFRVLQIKSKFAGLRYYVEHGDDHIRQLIDDYSSRSYKICEYCGGPGKRYSNGRWLYTVCDQHALEIGNK